MTVILSTLADPTDLVIQGWIPLLTEVSMPLIPAFQPTTELQFMVAGDTPIAQATLWKFPILNAIRHSWYGLPTDTGPMALQSSSNIVYAPLCDPLPSPVLIDPILMWLNQYVGLDNTGIYTDLNDYQGFLQDLDLPPLMIDLPTGSIPKITIPITEIIFSSPLKRITCPVPGKDWLIGQILPIKPNGSDQKYLISGVTRDRFGNALGNCNVIFLRTDKLVINIDQYSNPVDEITVSDGSGNFSLQVNWSGPWQLIAYLPGLPDVAGITVNNITAILG